MGEKKFTKAKNQNFEADKDGQINKYRALLAFYDADKSGNQGSFTTGRP